MILRGLTGVDDSLEAGDDFLAVDEGAGAADLPEALARGRDVVVLDVAGVELVVRPADVQLGVTGGELERENALVDSLLVDGSPEVGVLIVAKLLEHKYGQFVQTTYRVELGDGGEGQTHQAVVRAANKITALGSYSGEFLISDVDAGNTDCSSMIT